MAIRVGQNFYDSGYAADDAINAQRSHIAQVLAAQALGLSLPQYEAMQGVPVSAPDLDWSSDPANEGTEAGLGGQSALGGTLGGLGAMGLGAPGAAFSGSFGQSAMEQGAAAPGLSGYAPGTGLGMATTGYGSGYGAAHAAAAIDAAATTGAIMGASALSQSVNDAVDATGYNTEAAPSAPPGWDPGASNIDASLGGFNTANASMSDPGGYGAPAGFGSDPGGYGGSPGGFGGAPGEGGLSAEAGGGSTGISSGPGGTGEGGAGGGGGGGGK